MLIMEFLLPDAELLFRSSEAAMSWPKYITSLIDPTSLKPSSIALFILRL